MRVTLAFETMSKSIIKIDGAKLKPIRCKKKLKGTWQDVDSMQGDCPPLAFAADDIVFDWNGGGGNGYYELIGKRFHEVDVQIVIDDRPFKAKAWFLDGRGVVFSCLDCGTKKKFAGVRFLINNTHSRGDDELSMFLIDKMNFRQ